MSFRLAQSESAGEWSTSVDLIRRGLLGNGPEMIGVDGGSGLLAALPNRRPGKSPEAELPRTELAFADHPLVPVYLVFNAIPRRITLPK